MPWSAELRIICVSGSLIRSSTFQFDLLAKFGRQIAHDSRQFLPGIADRLHARLHDAFLQLGSDMRQPLQRHLEFVFGLPARQFKQLVAGQNQLGDHRHQMFERVDIDADRLISDPLIGPVLVLARELVLGRILGRASDRRRCRPRRLAKGPLQFVERDFARTQRPLQHLTDQRAAGLRGRRRRILRRHPVQLADQIGIIALRLALLGLERVENAFDAIDGGQNERNRLGGDRRTVAEFADHGFGGMRKRRQPRQT
jgi:hypothetical protein